MALIYVSQNKVEQVFPKETWNQRNEISYIWSEPAGIAHFLLSQAKLKIILTFVTELNWAVSVSVESTREQECVTKYICYWEF